MSQKPQEVLEAYYEFIELNQSFPGTARDAIDILWDMYMRVDPSIKARDKLKSLKQEGQ